MTIGSRIKKIRKELDLTQAAFAARIGSVQNSVTGYENGRRNPSQPVISLICSEFNVNKEWLETGEGEMFNPAPENELEALAEKYDLSSGAYVLIEKFLNLKKEQQDVIISFVKEAAVGLSEMKSQEKVNPATDIDIDAEVDAYRRALELQKKVAGGSSASNGQNGTAESEAG